MRLTRCQDQKSETLDEFYTRWAENDYPPSQEVGKTMLDLISRLRSLPDERRVFGLTSLHRLCLLAEDTSASPWFVIICASDKQNYSVEYLMPKAIAPWGNAYVKGYAGSEDEAVKMILIAMERSEGWAKRTSTMRGGCDS